MVLLHHPGTDDPRMRPPLLPWCVRSHAHVGERSATLDQNTSIKEIEDLSQNVATGSTLAPVASDTATSARTSALLICGVVAGPLFIVVGLAQAFTRPGFDLRRHVISMLSLGDLGWIQVANFELTGLLAVGFAIGLWRTLHPGRAGTWGPLLIGAYGIGMASAGIFHPDPALGFPPGAPAGQPTTFTSHAILHNVAFFLAFIGLIAACFVFMRRFAGLGQHGWAIYCAATGLAAPALIGIASTGLVGVGVVLVLTGVVTSGWIAVTALRLLSEQD